MRHTAYNDYAAEVRIRYFAHVGCPIEDFAKEGVGPILFTENTSFRKEIHTGENIIGNVKLSGLSEQGERWKLRHEIFNEAGKVAAVIDVYGAWLDLHKRKLTTLPDAFKHLFDGAEKTADFEIISLGKK
jgi:acyl-CoA thioester hydrolase